MERENRAALLAVVMGATSITVSAQEGATPALVFQLNKAQTVEAACQLTFVVQNETGVDITKSSYSMSIVDKSGQVDTIVTFEFGPFPRGRPKVQQFALPDLTCENLSAIAINEFIECLDGAGAQTPICEDAIKASSSIATIEFPWTL